jgi:uncharacterized membrane protein YeaQ/YmgE (transglycosylase-associated protein family)
MRPIAPIAVLAVLGGCAAREAPSYIVFGAYFPAWMFCAVLGIVGGLTARAVMVATGLSETLPFQLFVCASIGLIVAIAASLLWFGR